MKKNQSQQADVDLLVHQNQCQDHPQYLHTPDGLRLALVPALRHRNIEKEMRNHLEEKQLLKMITVVIVPRQHLNTRPLKEVDREGEVSLLGQVVVAAEVVAAAKEWNSSLNLSIAYQRRPHFMI